MAITTKIKTGITVQAISRIVLWLIWGRYRIPARIVADHHPGQQARDKQCDHGDDHQDQIVQRDHAILDRAIRVLHSHFPGMRSAHNALGPREWRGRQAENKPGHDRQDPLYNPHRLTTPTRSRDAHLKVDTRRHISAVRLPDATDNIKVSGRKLLCFRRDLSRISQPADPATLVFDRMTHAICAFPSRFVILANATKTLAAQRHNAPVFRI